MPHLDGAGHVVGLLGVSREITERKRLEDALRASKDHVQRILDSIADGLAVFDRDWNYTYVSAAGARLLGIPVAGLLGRNLWTLFPHAEGSGFGRAYREAMDTGRPTQVEAY